MKSPNWSIRTKLVVLLLPPLVTLLAMWIFATSLTYGDATELFSAQTKYDTAGKPAEDLVLELQRERRLTLTFVGSGRLDTKALTEQRPKTDTAAVKYRQKIDTDALLDASSAKSRGLLDATVKALDSLNAGRAAIDLGQADRTTAHRIYTEIIDSMYNMFRTLPGHVDESLDREAHAAIGVSRGREILAQEDALLHGAVAAGRFGPGDLAHLTRLIGIQRWIYTNFMPDLPGEGREAYDRALVGDGYTRIRQMEDRLTTEVRPNGSVPIDLNTWRSAYDAAIEQARVAEHATSESILERATPIGVTIVLRLVFAGAVGFIAIAASILLSVRVGRSLVRRLTRLRRNADELARERLPDLVSRLRRGEEVELPDDTPDTALGSDEIGEVGKAFDAVRQTALESAVHEARLRKGLSEVFLNLARRSQTLVHRQLSMLDRMERRATNAEELEDLFRVDHLATRMRRHAEDLVIIAGAAPGRGWRNPVPIVDVIRGAVSEVEDYARVGFAAIPDASIAGRAVADVIHLLAELIENATSFSPPHTKVQITGQIVPHGFALEIEDRGLGMPPEAIADANERLVNPPDFDPASSARLGLFVVSLLAARHGIRVTLRASPYGGLTAVVLVPKDLVVADKLQAALPSAEGINDTPVAPVLVLDPVNYDGERRARHTGRASIPGRTAIGGRQTTPMTLVEPSDIDDLPTPNRNGAYSAPGNGNGVHQPTPVEASSDPLDMSGTGDDGLPKRRRQANLAPQLRAPGTAPPSQTQPVPRHAIPTPPQAEPATDPSLRSPDEVRAMMSSFQAGLRRGRHEAATLDVHGQLDEERDA